MFEQIGLTVPDLEGISLSAKMRFEHAKAEVSAPNRFIGVSLGHWLDRVASAGVQHVPARRIMSIPREVWLTAEENHIRDAEIWSQLKLVCNGQAESEMVRLDPCSGISLKQAMHAGMGGQDFNARKELDPADPRAFDIIYEFPSDHIDIWSRPWVQAKYLSEHPIEFRVFIENNAIIGVANYYVQRSLPRTEEILGYVAACIKDSEKIITHLNSQCAYPWMSNYPEKFDPAKVSATCSGSRLKTVVLAISGVSCSN